MVVGWSSEAWLIYALAKRLHPNCLTCKTGVVEFRFNDDRWDKNGMSNLRQMKENSNVLNQLCWSRFFGFVWIFMLLFYWVVVEYCRHSVFGILLVLVKSSVKLGSKRTSPLCLSSWLRQVLTSFIKQIFSFYLWNRRKALSFFQPVAHQVSSMKGSLRRLSILPMVNAEPIWAF